MPDSTVPAASKSLQYLADTMDRLAFMSAPVAVHPDTERVDFLCKTYGMTRESIDEAIGK